MKFPQIFSSVVNNINVISNGVNIEQLCHKLDCLLAETCNLITTNHGSAYITLIDVWCSLIRKQK